MSQIGHQPRCRGLIGFIFGHKFTNWWGGTEGFCLRCGLRADAP